MPTILKLALKSGANLARRRPDSSGASGDFSEGRPSVLARLVKVVSRMSNIYDFIIVGAGSAGCVLAHRLSTDPGARVLLLEAGPPATHPDIEVPLAFTRLQRSALDWAYYTTPQTELADRPVAWPRGRVLGGSSAINAMVYMRGDLLDYTAWGPGWCPDCILPYFKRSQNQERPALAGSPFHAVGGPLNVTDLRTVNPLSHALLEAAASLGWPANDDFNGRTQLGAGLFQVTQLGGRRQSAAAAFLTPIRHRRNLQIVTGALVRRIRFDGDRAVGVEFSSGPDLLYAQAASEILLAAGAIESPKILLLSGIGPEAALRAHGIRLREQLLEVGENLQDHPRVALPFRCQLPVSLLNAFSPGSLNEYHRSGAGPWSSNGVEAGAFVGDLQFHFLPLDLSTIGLEATGHHGFTLVPTLLTPRSRGRLNLASADAADAPIIDPAYLSHPDDLPALREGVRLSYELAAAAFAPYGVEVGRLPDVDALIRSRLDTGYHPAGTCAIGPVVDQELRVNGLRNLRVVDASVIPILPRGNTHAPVVMIAERAADFILGLASHP